VSLLSSIFILVFSSIKFDIGFIDKNYLLTILESMPITIFRTVKIVTSRAVALYASCRSYYVNIKTNIHIEVSISYSTAYAATSNDVAVAIKKGTTTP
jgi:hypothetical protein